VAKSETLNRLFAKSNRSALGKNGKMDPPPLVRAAGCKFIVAPHRFPTYVVPRHIFLLTRRESERNDKLDVLLFEEDLLRRIHCFRLMRA
jgi:hypothetical protein